jgi:KUP system potassium uptake protein
MATGFLIVDVAFWSANLPKIPHGGWFPLVVAGAVFTLMTTWKTGRALLTERLDRRSLPVLDFIASIKDHPPKRVPGTAIFMTSRSEGVPRALLHNLKHNQVLHERVILFTVETLDTPYVPEDRRSESEQLGMGFHRVVARYGFAEDPDVPSVLRGVKIAGYEYHEMRDSFFFGEVTIIVPKKPGMARWRAVLFERMSRNALRASDYFRIPPGRVVGLGAQVEI